MTSSNGSPASASQREGPLESSPPATHNFQALAEAISSDPTNYCVAEVARNAGLSRPTVYRVLADPANRKALNRQVEARFGGCLPFVYARLLDLALNGPKTAALQAIRILLERFDPQWKRPQAHAALTTNIFQAIQTMSDDELRRWVNMKSREHDTRDETPVANVRSLPEA